MKQPGGFSSLLRSQFAVAWIVLPSCIGALGCEPTARSNSKPAATPASSSRAQAATLPGSTVSVELPEAKNVEAPIEALEITVATDALLVGDERLHLDDRATSAETAQFLPELARVLKNERELWLQLNPGRTFHGVVNVRADRGTSAALFKGIIYSAALVGFPNVSLLARASGMSGAPGRLFVDGRVPGLAQWDDSSPTTWLEVEVHPDGKAWTWWRRDQGRREDEAAFGLGELTSEVVRRWTSLGEARFASKSHAHRVMLRFPNDARYDTIVRAIDAMSEPRRTYELDSKSYDWPAFLTVPAANPGELDETLRGYWRWKPAPAAPP